MVGGRVLLVHRVEQPVGLVAEVERGPDVGDARPPRSRAATSPPARAGRRRASPSPRIASSLPSLWLRPTGARPSRGSRSSRSTRADDAPARARARPASSRSRAGPIRTCTAAGRGRSASTPGFASAEETNERFRYLLERGQTGLSVAFDLPTQLGYDSDDPRAVGEVGRTGVAIDSLADMELLFDGIPLDDGLDVDDDQRARVAAAAALRARRREAGSRGDRLRGTVQNDILKEYVARGNYIFPPRAVDAADDRPVRLLRRADPDAGTRSRSPGTTSARPARPRCRSSRSRSRTGSPTARRRSRRACRRTSSASGSRSSSTRTTTSSRRSRSSARRGGCGRGSCASASASTNPKALALRFHAQTGGSTLTAQQPENNIVRVAIQALVGGLRRRAVAAHELARRGARAADRARGEDRACARSRSSRTRPAATDTADPLGGSYFVEALTDELEAQARELIERIDELGGAVAAVEQGFVQGEIEEAAYRWPAAGRVRRARRRRRERVPGGRGSSRSSCTGSTRTQSGARSSARARVRAERDASRGRARARRGAASRARRAATCSCRCARRLRARCTVGEICDVLREEWGMYDTQQA